MSPVLLLTFLCLGMTSAAPTLDSSFDAQWFEWKAKHGKAYRLNEVHRRAIWEKNMQMIDLHNKEHSEGKHSYTLEMNAFGDMTTREFGEMMNGFQHQKREVGEVFQPLLFGNIPNSVDWREKGYVTNVKDQGNCGSCWAFSANGALEGQLFRKTGKLVSLSEQNLVDCARPQGNMACDGGTLPGAFQYVKDNGGLDTEESYPYEDGEGPCRYKPENSAANVTGYVIVPGNEDALMNAVATVGPISVALDASQHSFQFYKNGIYYDPECSSSNLNHGVLLVGYGFDESEDKKYWLIKNSWGEWWGMHGYMKIAKDKNNHCGIAAAACYPNV